MSTKVKVIIAAGLFVAVVTVMIVGSVIRGKHETEPQNFITDQPASSTPYFDTSEGTDPNLPSAVPTDQSKAVEATVTGFVKAFYGQSWMDSEATTWISRANAYTTKSYGADLQRRFGKGQNSVAWGDSVASKYERTAHVDSVQIVQSKDVSKGLLTVIVSFRTATKTADQATAGYEEYNRMIVMKEEGSLWMVDSFADVIAGYSSPVPTAALAPSAAPTVAD